MEEEERQPGALKRILLTFFNVKNISILLVVIGLVWYSPAEKHQTDQLQTTRFRETNFTGMFPLHDVDVVRGFDFDDDCPHRLSVVLHPNNTKQIWAVLPCSNSIFAVDIDSPSTNWITFPLQRKFQPKAAHQVSSQNIVIATETGLYLADTNGVIQYLIMGGKYSDVVFDGTKIYALEYHGNWIKMAHKKEGSTEWVEDVSSKIRLKDGCSELEVTCDDRYKTFLVDKKFFYVASSVGFKVFKYNRVGQLTDSYNHDHLLAEHNNSFYSGFSISAIDSKKTLALCNAYGRDIFLRKSDSKLHTNRLTTGMRHILDFVTFADEIFVLWGKGKYSLTHFAREEYVEEKMAKCNPKNNDDKYEDVRNIRGNFNILLAGLTTGRQKEIVKLNGVSHRLGIVQFDSITEFWVPIAKKHFIQVYTLQGIKSYEIYFPDFDYTYPIAVHQVHENEVILASEIGLFCLDRYGVIQYKLTDGKFSDVTFNGRRIIAMDYKNHRIVKFSKQQGIWVENPRVSFKIQSLHLESDSYGTFVVHGRHTYVASSTKFEVQKYSNTGTLLNNYQSQQKKASQRMRQSLTVSGIDSNGAILLCDFYNNQIETMSVHGQFHKYPIHDLRDIRDAVIIKQTMYILSGIANHKITAVYLH